MKHMPLFSDDFLLSLWDAAYAEYEESGADAVTGYVGRRRFFMRFQIGGYCELPVA